MGRHLPSDMRQMFKDIRKYADEFRQKNMTPSIITAGCIMLALEQLEATDSAERMHSWINLIKNLNSQLLEIDEQASEDATVVDVDEMQEMLEQAYEDASVEVDA